MGYFALCVGDLTRSENSVFSAILYRMKLSQTNTDKYSDENGVFCIFKVAQIAQAVKYCERTVKRALSKLRKKGYLKTTRQPWGLPNKIYLDVKGKLEALRAKQKPAKVSPKQPTRAYGGVTSNQDTLSPGEMTECPHGDVPKCPHQDQYVPYQKKNTYTNTATSRAPFGKDLPAGFYEQRHYDKEELEKAVITDIMADYVPDED